MKKSLGAGTYLSPTPAWLIGSYSDEGKPNIMTAAWAGICNSNPPCVFVSLQKPRATYANILKTKAFTINVASTKNWLETDYAGIVSGKKHDKFEETGFTAVKSQIVDAPYVEECPLVAECKVIQTIDLGSHTVFIGEILDVKVDENTIDEQGKVDMKKVSPILFGTTDRQYYGVGENLGQGFTVQNVDGSLVSIERKK